MKPLNAYTALCFLTLLHISCSTDTVAPSGDVVDMVVSESKTIATAMMVGNLTIKGSAILTIDFTSDPEHVFAVKGNVLVQDDGQLVVKGNKNLMNDGFIIANEFNSQYSITTTGNSIIRLENIGVRTQTGTVSENGNIYMSYFAEDHSAMIVDGAKLDYESSWLLATFNDQSRLEILNSMHVPTEIYLNDSCSVTIEGAETVTGLWMSLTSGAHTFQIPNVSTGSWSWSAGANLGPGVHWTLTVTNSNPGLGVNLFPGAEANITGHGVAPKELTIGYFGSGNNEVLDNLQVGLQNGVIVPGRLTLTNVHLGPIAWQIYSITPATLTVNNSIINEIGIVGSGSVIVNNSLLQLALLACYGQNSSLTVSNSDVWNQAIETDNNGQISLTNCRVFGSRFMTRTAQGSITIVGGSFHDNPPVDLGLTFVDLITGYPNYNPFSAPGPPRKSGTTVVSCTGVANCSW